MGTQRPSHCLSPPAAWRSRCCSAYQRGLIFPTWQGGMGERNFQTPKSPSPPCPPSSASNTAVPRRQCFSTPSGGTAGWPGGWSVRALGGSRAGYTSLFPPPTLTSKGTCEAGRGRATEPQIPRMQSSSAGGHSQPVYPVGLLWGVGDRHSGAEQRGLLQDRQRVLQIILKFGEFSRTCFLSQEEVVSAGCPLPASAAP